MQITLFGEDRLRPNDSLAVEAAGWPLLVTRLADGYRAVLNRCSHAGSRLDGGRVRNGTILCPRHGARFSLTDGACIGGPYQPLRTFTVAVIAGQVVAEVPDERPRVDELPVAMP